MIGVGHCPDCLRIWAVALALGLSPGSARRLLPAARGRFARGGAARERVCSNLQGKSLQSLSTLENPAMVCSCAGTAEPNPKSCDGTGTRVNSELKQLFGSLAGSIGGKLGKTAGCGSLRYTLIKSTSRNQGWSFTAIAPPVVPSRVFGSASKSRWRRWTASGEIPLGISKVSPAARFAHICVTSLVKCGMQPVIKTYTRQPRQ
mmetsp:Transcript_144779/g.265902  ORF Transcript_144779/g.265902 Transcript_144779/m.265902 type:complete len:204 (-) Transcript_144779:1197-1808(-)